MNMEEVMQWPVVGKGSERICYQNPNNPSRCIKVSKKSRAKQTWREVRYFQYLTRIKIPFTYIPRFYGIIEDSQFIGVEQEFIRDSGEENPKDLYHYLKVPLSPEEQAALWAGLDELKSYLLTYNIIPSDLVMSNLLVIRQERRIKIMMIDGLGSTEIIPLSNYISIIGRRKIKRKWARFMDKKLVPYYKKMQVASSHVA